jgi:membrane associated rhomboid family serine protease
MGAYMVKFPHSRILTLVPVFVFITTMEIPAVLILVYWFIIQLFSGVGTVAFSQASAEGGGVAWFAHIGGFVAGVLLIFLMRPHERYRRRPDLRW